MAEHRSGDVGSVAEETARLVAALREYAVPPPPSEGAPAGQTPPPSPSASRCADHDARGERPVACELCPVCQGIAVLHSLRPEVVERLAELASTAAAFLGELAQEARSGSERDPGPGADTSGWPAPERPASRERHHDIPVTDGRPAPAAVDDGERREHPHGEDPA
ncbi:MAG: hypothetical protein LWW86_00160 [Micrococcales bacterium]|nr:hypothetical protein [Micrococcales bacterium]